MKLLVVFGTRPEAIKLAPVIRQVRKKRGIKCVVCVTAQHRGMLDQVLKIFDISPDYDLNIMKDNQDLFDVVAGCMNGLKRILRKEKPDMVMVQGDTTTAFIAGLAAYYCKIPVAHVEAGLRTYDKFNPFPEEINRRSLGMLADLHFAPTAWAKNNLLKENIPADKIWVTGNTGIDALNSIADKQGSPASEKKYYDIFRKRWGVDLRSDSGKIVLVTGHRRESFGGKFRDICMALKDIAAGRKDVRIIYPVHLNPNVQKPVRSILGRIANIKLIEPVEYDSFIFLMRKAHILLTDSGGIQEEAPSLGKPVLVMRDTTERPEGIKAGAVKMIGTKRRRIITEVLNLLNDQDAYKDMSRSVSPYGDGNAAKRIVDVIWKNRPSKR